MPDDKTKRGSPDNKRLNKAEPYEMAHARKKAGKKAGQGKGASGSRPTAKAAATSAARPAAKPAAKKPARKAQSAAARSAPKPPKGEKTGPNTAPRTMKTPDAVDLLVDDHLEVDVRFKRFEKLADKNAPADQRKALAQEICALLKAHTAVEEEIFYPAARAAGVDADLLDEADIEHTSAKDLIRQIEAGDAGDDKFNARVTVLGEYINHHVVEEHMEMFPKCRRAGMDLVALRAALESRKAELTANGAG